MIWWAGGLYLLILILVFPIRLKTDLSYSLYQNNGYIRFYLWGAKLFDNQCLLNGKQLVLISKKKITKVNINKFGNTNLSDRFLFSLIKMIKINNVGSNVVIGLKDDMYIPSCISGFLLCVQNIIFAIFSTKKKLRVTEIVVLPTNLGNELNIKFSFCFTICLLQVLTSFLYALIKKQKGVNYGKQSN